MGAPSVTTWRWTAESFERAGELGLFGEGTHADLIDGEVHLMSPQSPLHAFVIRVLKRASAGLEPGYTGQIQLPVRLASDTELEPDLAVVVGPDERYGHRHPGPDDIELAVEVSLSTLGYDAGEKLSTYARYSVPLVWIVDVARRQVLVYSAPEPAEGVYTQVRTERVGQLSHRGLEVQIEELWPPEAD